MATGGGDSDIVDEVDKITFTTEQLGDFKSAGYVGFILNYEGKNFPERSFIGAEKDAEHFKNVFDKTLGLEWINEKQYKNLKVSNWDHSVMGGKYEFKSQECCLRCNILSRNYANCKFFVLVASSHGIELQEPKILMCDDEESSDGEQKFVLLSEITDVLRDEKLASMTKIVILHSCRSRGDEDEGIPNSAEGAVGGTADKRDDKGVVTYIEVKEKKSQPHEGAIGDSTNMSEDVSEDVPSSPVGAYGRDQTSDLPVVHLGEPPADFLIVFSTTKGRRAQFNEKQGSWMYYCMNKVAEKLDTETTKLNFLKFLTKTNDLNCKLETCVFKKDEDGDTLYVNWKPVKDENKQFKTTMCITHRLCEIPMFDLGVAKSRYEERKRQESVSEQEETQISEDILESQGKDGQRQKQLSAVASEDLPGGETLAISNDGPIQGSSSNGGEREEMFTNMKKKRTTKAKDLEKIMKKIKIQNDDNV